MYSLVEFLWPLMFLQESSVCCSIRTVLISEHKVRIVSFIKALKMMLSAQIFGSEISELFDFIKYSRKFD